MDILMVVTANDFVMFHKIMKVMSVTTGFTFAS